MSKICFVFSLPSADRAQMEETLRSYNLVVGPFGQDNEKELSDFLSTKLPYLRAVSRENDHEIILHLVPEKSGWLIELINRYSHQGLSGYSLAGLLLDTKSYVGSPPQLWAEVSSFGGKKYLAFAKKSGEYCQRFLEQMSESPWNGLFMSSADDQEETRVVRTIACVRIAYEAFKLKIPIWTEGFSSEEKRTRTVFAGSKGFFISDYELLK